MKFLYLATRGAEDPTHACMPLFFAKGAKDAGHEVEVVMAGDAVVLFQETTAENTKGVGMPNAKELMASMKELKIPVYG